jgi:hypothetical protein
MEYPLPYRESDKKGRRSAMKAREYTVKGMTCSHCVASVRDEVSEVAGVAGV